MSLLPSQNLLIIMVRPVLIGQFLNELRTRVDSHCLSTVGGKGGGEG